ncbi:SCP domain-containing protein [Psidium guajava]|nr:SCP domain-containing protein [Psidium guajava]
MDSFKGSQRGRSASEKESRTKIRSLHVSGQENPRKQIELSFDEQPWEQKMGVDQWR